MARPYRRGCGENAGRADFPERRSERTVTNGRIISWHPQLGAFGVIGAIDVEWLALGRERYGHPVTDELPCPDGRGRFNHLRTISWTARHGVDVHGPVLFDRGTALTPVSD